MFWYCSWIIRYESSFGSATTSCVRKCCQLFIRFPFHYIVYIICILITRLVNVKQYCRIVVWIGLAVKMSYRNLSTFIFNMIKDPKLKPRIYIYIYIYILRYLKHPNINVILMFTAILSSIEYKTIWWKKMFFGKTRRIKGNTCQL